MSYPVWTTNDRNARLAYPHYSDERWNRAQVIFGATSEGLQFEYDDRLQQYDYAKHDAAIKTAKRSGAGVQTAAWWDAYLTAYFGQKIEVACIMAGSNLSTCYPYYVLGFKPLASDAP